MVSIIVPVYNVALYLERCVDSIIKQNFAEFELILIDDGTPDNSSEICDEYAVYDERIMSIHHINGGVSSARNIGIDVAQGIYVTFVDSDDWVDKKYISGFSLNSADLICQTAITLSEEGNIITVGKFKPLYCKVINVDIIKELLCQYILDWTHCKIFRRDIIKKNNLYFDLSLDFGEDTLFTIQYVMKCKSVMVEDVANYRYVIYNSRNTLSSSYTRERLEMLYEANWKISLEVFSYQCVEQEKLYAIRMRKVLCDEFASCFSKNQSLCLSDKISFCQSVMNNPRKLIIMQHSNVSTIPAILQKSIVNKNNHMLYVSALFYKYFLVVDNTFTLYRRAKNKLKNILKRAMKRNR